MFVVAIIITIIVIISSLNNKKVAKSVDHKYDINKTIGELQFKSNKEFRDYLKDISKHVNPKDLIKLINYNEYFYSENLDNNRNGKDMMLILTKYAYQKMIEIVIQKNEKWDKLPLTEHFKSKFNEKDGCIKEIDSDKIYVHNFGYSDDNKTFSIEYSYIPDDAYEKYPAEQIEFMLEYGAGAYNLDYYNYQYVLDDEGYLDDIIFLGITPHIVEGRYVDEDE